VAFGALHMVLQQKVTAAAAGLVIGYLAVQTESLVPCIVFHAVHNGLMLTMPSWAAKLQASGGDGLAARLLGGKEPLLYHQAVVVFCGGIAAAMLWSLRGLSYRRTAEEQLEEARQRRDSPLVGT
jgi:sodium transport system permease protein